jgi:hypothetical protein
MRYLWEKYYKNQKNYCISKPVDYNKKLNVFYIEKIVGIPFSKTLRFRGLPVVCHFNKNKIYSGIKKSASWLKYFHEITLQSRKSKLINLIDEDLKELQTDNFNWADKKLVDKCVSKIKEFFYEILEKEQIITGLLGDFYDENIIMNNNKTTVIDFAQFRYGNPLWDVTKFIVNLDIQKNFIFYNTNFFNLLEKKFLRTYNESNNILSFSGDVIKQYKPIILIHELKWCDFYKQSSKSKNPFINTSIDLINKYVRRELNAFLNKNELAD